jgi:hypothetical protein
LGSSDVAQLGRLLRGELELVAGKLGTKLVSRPGLAIRDAAPRESFVQAQALFRKSERLLSEYWKPMTDVR